MHTSGVPLAQSPSPATSANAARAPVRGRRARARSALGESLPLVVWFGAVFLGAFGVRWLLWRAFSPVGPGSQPAFLVASFHLAPQSLLIGVAALVTGVVWAVRWVRRNDMARRVKRVHKRLGDERLDMRVRGIAQLAQIARSDESYHRPIMDALITFVHVNASVSSVQFYPTRAPEDVQAALQVLGRRRVNFDGGDFRLDLRHTALCGSDLQRANFDAAFLQGAHLEKARLNQVRLRHANLAGAFLDGAVLSNASLEGANLVKAHLSGAVLHGAHLEGADLRGAIGLTTEQMLGAFVDSRTRLPSQLNRSRPHHEDDGSSEL
jgi:hypothetical protein